MSGANTSGGPSASRAAVEAGASALDRIFSFRVVYLAFSVFLVLYVFSVRGTEALLRTHFREALEEAVRIESFDEPVSVQIQSQIRAGVSESPWVRIGGVRVTMHVFGRNGRLLHLNGHATTLPPPGFDSAAILRDAEALLPATAEIDDVSIPIESLLSSTILVVYAAILLQGLFTYYRRVAARERAILERAQSDRDAAAARSTAIERDLERVRRRLQTVEPAEREHADEIRQLERERGGLRARLANLEAREQALRGRAARAIELDEEREALETLLDEAAADLAGKDTEIRQLEKSLKRASKIARKAGGRSRESELLARRLRTLYKDLEIDDRAVDDLVGLRDETMMLKAEESLKRLIEEADNVAVRRKVGGLPPYLSIFELGFAGKGRIYYTRGKTRRVRVLTIGAKNSQKTDIEYLSRLDRREMA